MKRVAKKVGYWFFRGLGLFLLFLLLSIGVGSVILQLMLTPDTLQAVLTGQLQEALRRPVQMDDLRVVLFQGIKVRGLRVLEGPEFPTRQLLTADIAVVKFRLLPLLWRQVVLSEAKLVHPRISVFRRQDGQWNISDIFASTGAIPSASPYPLAVALRVENFELEKGVLTYEDLRAKQEHVLEGLNLAVEGFHPYRPFSVRLGFGHRMNLRGKIYEGSCRLSAFLQLADFEWAQAGARIEELRFQTPEGPVSISGLLTGFNPPRGRIELALPPLKSEQIIRYAPFPDGVDLPAMRVALAGKAQPGTSLELEEVSVLLPGASIRGKGVASFQEPKTWRLFLSGAGDQVERLAGLWRPLKGLGLQGNLQWSVIASGRGEEWSLGRTRLRVRKFRVNLEKTKLAAADIHLVGSKGFEEGTLRVAGGRGTLYGEPVESVQIEARASGGDLALERFTANWAGGTLALSGKVRRFKSPARIELEGSMDRLRLQSVLDLTAHLGPDNAFGTGLSSGDVPEGGSWGEGSDPGQVKGWVAAFKRMIPEQFPSTVGKFRVGQLQHPNFTASNVGLDWNLRGVDPGLARLGGNLRIDLGGGRITDIPSLQSQNKVLRVIFLPFVFMQRLNNMGVLSLATAYPENLVYDRIHGEYDFLRGVVHVRSFFVQSEPLLAAADGWVDFVREKIDLHILTRLNRGREALPEMLVDIKGRPSIAFRVEDDLKKPTVRLDYKKMEPDAIEKAIEQGLRRKRA